MAVPKPEANETQGKYVARAMADADLVKSYPIPTQRLALVYATWRANKHFLNELTPDPAQPQPVKFPLPKGMRNGRGEIVGD